MRQWRHSRDQHPIIARFVFQLIQVKQRFRPIRRIGLTPKEQADLAAATWREAEREGVPVIAPENKSRRVRRRRQEHKDPYHRS
mmetsp:Transcript_4684/g.7140  ORF Transcript_4684/g.7140 Transcript_4684/m.7140 type:complete len:84 (+) Transcript_4684:405-656(+)